MSEFEKLQIAGLQPSVLANRLGLQALTLTRLFAKIHVLENGCWQWMGGQHRGYGTVHIRYLPCQNHQAHRLFYQLVHGPLDSTIPLHHKVEDGCIGPSCCNPGHLQETTPAEHTRELSPASIAFIASHRNHCAAGHPYTIESIRIVKDGTRQCRICDKIKAQEKRDRLRGDRPKFAKDPATFKTHCKRGHLLEGDNIRMVSSPSGRLQRYCLLCEKIRNEGYIKRHDAALLAGTMNEFANSIRPRKEFCKNGHELDADNLYIRSDGRGLGCKVCRLEKAQRWQAEHREEYLESRKARREAERADAPLF